MTEMAHPSGTLSRKERKALELKAREREDYNVVAPHYDELITRITDPFGLRTVEMLDVQPGHRVLEIACGPGKLIPTISNKVGPNGRLTCFDQSDAMLDISRGRAKQHGLSNVEFLQGDAEVLAGVNDASLDRLLMVFGLMYLPDPEGALRLFKRKLKDRGRLAITVWGMPADVPGLAVPMEAGARVLMPPPLSWFIATGAGRSLCYWQLVRGEKLGGGKTPMCLAPRGLLEGMFERVGLKNVRRDEHREVFEYATADEYWTVLLGTPARTAIQQFPEPKIQRAKEVCAQILRERYATPNGGVAIPMTAVTVVGDL
jgi:SAM-dependent methyltransferase